MFNGVADIRIGQDRYFKCLIYLLNGYHILDESRKENPAAYDAKFEKIYNTEKEALKKSFNALPNSSQYMDMDSSFPVNHFSLPRGDNIFLAPLECYIKITNNMKGFFEWLNKIGALNKLKYKEFDSSILMYETANGRHSDELSILTSCGSNFKVCDNEGKTILHLMALKNRLPALDTKKDQLNFFKYIIDNVDKEFLNIQDAHGNTVLHYAALHKNINIMELLKKKKIDTQIKNKDGKTAESLLQLNDKERANLLDELCNSNITKREHQDRSFLETQKSVAYFMDLNPSEPSKRKNNEGDCAVSKKTKGSSDDKVILY